MIRGNQRIKRETIATAHLRATENDGGVSLQTMNNKAMASVDPVGWLDHLDNVFIGGSFHGAHGKLASALLFEILEPCVPISIDSSIQTPLSRVGDYVRCASYKEHLSPATGLFPT
jgi:hypothetical protein